MFIPYEAARPIVTEDRVRRWSRDHRLCQEHAAECPEMANTIHEILARNVLLFVVLVFAELEYLIKKLIASNSDDTVLFDTRRFDSICKSAGLNDEEKLKFTARRCAVGVAFSDSVIQHVPRDAVLPFIRRENLGKSGSS